MRIWHYIILFGQLSLISACTSLGGGSSVLKTASTEDPATTGSISASSDILGQNQIAPVTTALMGGDRPDDELTLGKKHFLAQNYGLAEQYFRKAVEKAHGDGEAWLGLAAAYDRLKRFDMADRAYQQALIILGPTADVLNNQGYSFMLRGQFREAGKKLAEAKTKDPANPYVKSNLELLEAAAGMGKGIN